MEFWTKSLDFLRAQWIDTWNTLAGAVGSISDAFWGWWKEGPGKAMREDMLKSVEELQRKYNLEESTIKPLRDAVDKPFPLDVVYMALISFPIHFLGLFAFWTSYKQRAQLEVNELERLTLLDPSTLVAFAYKNPQHKALVDKLLAMHGISDQQIDMLYQSAQQEPSLMEVLTLVNRKEYSEDEGVTILTRQGFSEDDAQRLLTLRQWLPSPQDIVSLAGREAYEEDSIRAYKLDSFAPERMYEEGAKVGISRATMRQFWIAHWGHPSLNQVMEMIQRKAPKGDGTVWTLDDLELYARLVDLNPYFVQGIRHIAYATYGRVDIRRMYQLGVLKEDELQRAYEDIGYPPDKAANMVKFTLALGGTKEKDLTKAQIDTLYKDGFIDALEYRNKIKELGYDGEEAQFLQDLVDFAIQKEEREAQIKATRRKYFKDLIQPNEARAELVTVHLSSAKIDALLRQWDDEKPGAYTLPTKQDTLDWFTSGELSAEEFVLTMRELGYRAKDIDHYRNTIAFTPALSTVLGWFAAETISEDQAQAYMRALGIQEREIGLYLADGRRTIEARARIRAEQAAGG